MSRAARSRPPTYRAWRSRPPAARTISDTQVVDAVRTVAWTSYDHGRPKLTPEGRYRRRKMTAHLRRSTTLAISSGAVDRAMQLLGLSGVCRDKGIRTTIPAKDGKRAGDLVSASPGLSDSAASWRLRSITA